MSLAESIFDSMDAFDARPRPLVSIIMTAYNADCWVQQCLDSILKQSFENWELIAWNDGSDDATWKILKEASGADKRIRAFDMPHEGRIASLLGASKEIRGQFVVQIDADDWLKSEKALALLVEAAEKNPDAGMVYAGYSRFTVDGTWISNRQRGPYSREALLQGEICHGLRMIRREAFEKIGGYNTDYPLAMDYDLCLRLAEHFDAVKVDEFLYCHRRRDTSISAVNWVERKKYCEQAVKESLERLPL